MDSGCNLVGTVRSRSATLALIVTAIFIGALCVALGPSWETNDDTAMAMVAHGYGLAAYGSPHLIFSNVVWGHLVRAIPSIGGVSGYALATVACLVMIGWSTLYFLRPLGAPDVVTLLAVVLLLARPTLFPQFTLNAGLLTVAAIIGWRVHARDGDVGSLLAACVLAFLGYLIRGMEFILVLAVGLPLLPWRALRQERRMQIAIMLLGVAIITAAVVDRWSYHDAQWTAFSDLNLIRAQFTDFGADARLLQRPEIMTRYGYSENDVHLIGSWFFVDSRIADPVALNAILAELGLVPLQTGSIRSGLAALETLAAPKLLPLLFPALVLLALAPRRSVVLSWLFCLVALFAIGMAGRPGVLRIYVPLLTLLLVAPLVVGQLADDLRRRIAACALLVALSVNAYMLIPEALAAKQKIWQVRNDIQLLPDEPIVTWGAHFPFEYAFPPLAKDLAVRAPKFYGLGVFTLAPFSVASAEAAAGRGMIERLQSAAGVSIIASPNEIELLRTYCRERLSGRSREIATRRTPSFIIYQLQCEKTR